MFLSSLNTVFITQLKSFSSHSPMSKLKMQSISNRQSCFNLKLQAVTTLFSRFREPLYISSSRIKSRAGARSSRSKRKSFSNQKYQHHERTSYTLLQKHKNRPTVQRSTPFVTLPVLFLIFLDLQTLQKSSYLAKSNGSSKQQQKKHTMNAYDLCHSFIQEQPFVAGLWRCVARQGGSYFGIELSLEILTANLR